MLPSMLREHPPLILPPMLPLPALIPGLEPLPDPPDPGREPTMLMACGVALVDVVM